MSKTNLFDALGELHTALEKIEGYNCIRAGQYSGEVYSYRGDEKTIKKIADTISKFYGNHPTTVIASDYRDQIYCISYQVE